MIGTAVTVSYSLATGFERAAERADLADVVARFAPERRTAVDRRIRALPNLEARSYRLEFLDVALAGGSGSAGDGAVHAVPEGRRGYAVLEGRDLSGRRGEILIGRGLASDWSLAVGDSIRVAGGPLRIVGTVLEPDDVAYPLAGRPRVYVARAALPDRLRGAAAPVNVALVWARDRSRVDSLLVQARAVSFGLEDLRFVTRAGVRALVDQATGIVIALLLAFSLVAAGAAGLMLGTSARADVERRLVTIGVLRAIGASRSAITARYALDAALVALPAATAGLSLGALLAAGPSAGLLEILNELAPGAALVGPLVACLGAIVATVVLATAWPAWRAASRPPAQTLRGPGLADAPPRAPTPGGPFGLGLRLAVARRGRTLTVGAIVAAAAAVVLLMLSLASFLDRLQSDPGALGKRYQLTAELPAQRAPEVAALPGVEAAAARYEAEAVSSFELGQPLRLIAYPGDHTAFEAPPLAAGRRIRGSGEAEVGVGLAETLGLRPGGALAVQLPTGAEVRFRVVGLVRAIENEGRIAYVRPRRLLTADGDLDSTIAVRVSEGASTPAVARGLERLGAKSAPPRGATATDATFLAALAAVLRVVAAVNAAICLYALAQALVLTAIERRGVIAVLRVAGASGRTVALVLMGTACALLALALPAGVLLERLLLGPAVADLAAGYATLPLGASAGQVLLVAAGLAALAAGAAGWVARRVEREPIVPALRGAG